MWQFIFRFSFITPEDQAQASTLSNAISDKSFVAGDTKFDRAVDRKHSGRILISDLNDNFPSDTFKLLIGSAWPKDFELVSEFYKNHLISNKSLQLVVAPHKPTAEFIQSIIRWCRENKLTFQQFSKRNNTTVSESVVIIDEIGYLFELYGSVDCAFVGGGSHYQVHNVLEPSVYGLPLAFGPKFHNSHEAVSLVSSGLASVIKNKDEGSRWLNSCLSGKWDGKTIEFVRSNSGATEKLLSDPCFDFEA